MQRWLIIGAVVVVVLGYMTADTVRFTESAVVTTFGRATEENVRDGSKNPGLLFTVPWVQRVTKYDGRVRLYEARPEMQQTRDNRQMAVTTFVTWRVSDPLAFYRRFGGHGRRVDDHYREAEKLVRGKLRSSLSELGRYRLDQLLTTRPEDSLLERLEEDMKTTMQSAAGGETSLDAHGIEIVAIGISGMTFPQETSKKVFEAMRENRTRIAMETISQGNSRADTIRKSAEADAERIRVFAQQLATTIRAQGEAEAAQYFQEMNEDPQLAIFLQNMKFIRESFGRSTTTLVLPTSLPGFDMFRPDALRNGVPPARPAAIDEAAETVRQATRDREGR